MPKRKKRLLLNWGPILWALFLANTAAGLMVSPATAVTRVRVEGAQASDHERIRAACQPLRDQALLKAPSWTVLESVLRRPDVKSADINLNLLGRGLIDVNYHELVARVAGVPTLGLSADGGLIPVTDLETPLPTLRLDPSARGPIATIVGNWQGRSVAEVCRRAGMADLGNVIVEAQANGAVNLILKDARIELGAPDKLVEKFDHIARFRAQDPQLLSGGATLVLISPDRPSVRNSSAP